MLIAATHLNVISSKQFVRKINVIKTFVLQQLKLRFSGYNNERYLQVVPWGFRKLLNWIAKEYNNPPVLITENGFSDNGGLNDTDRVDYHLVSGSISGFLL
jgi:beta-glucosidase/6-phospho-beta-glucosidase/beta-galactosidase